MQTYEIWGTNTTRGRVILVSPVKETEVNTFIAAALQSGQWFNLYAKPIKVETTLTPDEQWVALTTVPGEAVKAFRNRTSCTLVEAVNVVNAYRANAGLCSISEQSHKNNNSRLDY